MLYQEQNQQVPTCIPIIMRILLGQLGKYSLSLEELASYSKSLCQLVLKAAEVQYIWRGWIGLATFLSFVSISSITKSIAI